MRAARGHCELRAGKGWQLSRDEVREARLNLRSRGDVCAAERLLRHSIACDIVGWSCTGSCRPLLWALSDWTSTSPTSRRAAERLQAGVLAAAEEEAKTLIIGLGAALISRIIRYSAQRQPSARHHPSRCLHRAHHHRHQRERAGPPPACHNRYSSGCPNATWLSYWPISCAPCGMRSCLPVGVS